MIDIEAEAVLSIPEAAALFAGRRPGKRVNVATVYRWARRGVRGVRLEAVAVGGMLKTSREAVLRFLERLNARRSGAGEPATPPRLDGSKGARAKAAKEAERIFG